MPERCKERRVSYRNNMKLIFCGELYTTMTNGMYIIEKEYQDLKVKFDRLKKMYDDLKTQNGALQRKVKQLEKENVRLGLIEEDK